MTISAHASIVRSSAPGNAGRGFLFAATLLVAIVLLASGLAHAGAREDIEASMQKFVAAKSWHATMRIDGKRPMTNELDFTAPDRYRIQMAGMGTQYIIGDSMTISMQGHTMKVPMPKGTLSRYRDPVQLHENAKSITAEALGKDTIDGKQARKYSIHNREQPDADMLMWIGGDDYPVQIKVANKGKGAAAGTVTFRYSRFNDPTIRVQAP